MDTQNLVKRTLSTPAALEQVRLLAAHAPHRTALAEQVCERFELRDARGRTQRSTALKALRDLERAGSLTLPAPSFAPRRPRPRGLDAPVSPPLAVPSVVVQVGDIELVEVTDEDLRRVWTELMRREHPLGAPTLAGHQLRYLVRSAHGWLGALGFAAAALKLAARCADTQVVGVMDREADIFELFEQQRQDPRVELLVRAKNNRCIADDEKLFEHLRAAPERARLHIAVGRQSARPKASKQKLKAKRKERLAEVSLHYERIELTTLPVESREDAERMLRWYGLRWRIEDWHRVIKSGCRVERLAHDSAERLERAIAMRLVIAWRIMLMTLLVREVPELPAELLFSDIELEVLTAYAPTLTRQWPPPATIGAAVKLVAIMGGYMARNNDGPPGHQVMWLGMVKLAGMCEGYMLHRTLS